MSCYAPIKRLYRAVFNSNSLEVVQEKLNAEDAKTSSEIVEKLLEKGLLKKISAKIHKVNKQKNVLKTILLLVEKNGDRVKEIFDIVYPYLDEARLRSDCLLELFQIVNIFLFEFQKLSRGDIHSLIVFARNLVSFMDKCFPTDVNFKVDYLIRIYFGIQYVAHYTTDFVLKVRALSIFDQILSIIHDEIHQLETTFFFDEGKNFLRMSLTYKGESVFSSFDSRISKYYFDFIARTIVENDKQFPEVNKWAEGNLLSVFYTIKKDKLGVIAKPVYVNALCCVCTNLTSDENVMIGVKSVNRVLLMDERCEFVIKRYFQRKEVDLNKIFGIVGMKCMNDEKMEKIVRLSELMKSKHLVNRVKDLLKHNNISMGKMMLKQEARCFANVMIRFADEE